MKSFIPWLFISCASAATLASVSGIATFNDYRHQPSTVCHGRSHAYLDAFPKGTYAAAVGDLSHNIWSGGRCEGSIDRSKCNGQQPVSGYVGPACPHNNCLKCFRVCNEGSWDAGSHTSGVGKCIKVQIVDACPSESAYNYCKTNVPSAERCGSTTNALDIDLPGYKGLTGSAWDGSKPNLKVSVQSVSC